MDWLDKMSPRIHHGGYRHFSEGIINPWRVISDHEYFVFEEGYGALIIDGRTYSCPERSYIIIPSGKRHISYAYSKEILLHWAHFDWVPKEYQHSAQTFMEPTIPDPACLRPAPDFVPAKVLHGRIESSRVFVLLRKLSSGINSDNAFERKLTSATALELFLRLLSPSSIVRKTAGTSSYSAAEDIRGQLTEIANCSMAASPSLEQALSIGGYSYSRQERIFREVFGITPHQYVTSLRVERIRHLLNESTLTIGDISDKMGFKDPAYFSRFVTKHFGLPPRDLRK